MKKTTCLLPLALGTFGLGITEYVMMGILPDIAKTMKVSIPLAGNFISSYALGVVFGSILLVLLGRTKPLKNILIVLVSIFTLANFSLAFINHYSLFCLVRFIAGLPHGAFFGVGAIVASKISDNGKENSAVAKMVSGMAIANLCGIPFGTFISHAFSWRIIFIFVGLFGLFILYTVLKLVPRIAPPETKSFISQFKIFKSLSVWILILAVILGNGGIFCWYSYINPLLVNLSGIKPQFVSILMILAGAGMCIGTGLAGKLSDKFKPSIIASLIQLIACKSLILIFLFGHISILSIILMFICTGCLFGVSTPQQTLLIKYAKGGEMLGASCSQISFNLGNAIGAFVGGIPISLGYGYQYTALYGSVFTVIGFILLYFFYLRYECIRTNP